MGPVAAARSRFEASVVQYYSQYAIEIGLARSYGTPPASRRGPVAVMGGVSAGVGPPGSGKTLRLFARIVRQHPGPVLATSTKVDLFEVSVAERDRRGPVMVLDPDGLAPAATAVRWSPVAGCEDSRVAERRAQALVAASGNDSGPHADFFRGSAADVLKGYLHAAALANRTMRDVLRWASKPTDPTPTRILAEHPTSAVDWAGTIATHTTGAEQTTSGVMRTLARALACFGHSDVLAMCCPEPGEGFDVDGFLESSGTLYLLGTPPSRWSFADCAASTTSRTSSGSAGSGASNATPSPTA